MKHCKLLLAVLGATVLLASLVGSANARSFSSTSQTFRRTFSRFSFGGAFGNITCQITLEGSLHTRTIAKTVGALIGYITAAAVGPCAEGTFTILRETLPWHMRYGSFTGTLPTITSIRENLIGFSFRIREPFITCLIRSTAESPMVLNFNRNTATGALETAEVGGTIGSSCGIAGTFSSNRGPVTVLNSTTRITVTLI